ncbi:hypothetical protein HMPREF9104_00493 [Lentilactobacillus kisonensis F0435]|uniref:Uncharacterized protein n=1 Tax=Lentilactobacillus kisonensis F0435 TaxID=797516 RepID=H1LD29_9LACO|nr:hypothetical protein HMPREF9104_00493 [Lentilactobacillus kisonensis F0435]
MPFKQIAQSFQFRECLRYLFKCWDQNVFYQFLLYILRTNWDAFLPLILH